MHDVTIARLPGVMMLDATFCPEPLHSIQIGPRFALQTTTPGDTQGARRRTTNSESGVFRCCAMQACQQCEVHRAVELAVSTILSTLCVHYHRGTRVLLPQYTGSRGKRDPDYNTIVDARRLRDSY